MMGFGVDGVSGVFTSISRYQESFVRVFMSIPAPNVRDGRFRIFPVKRVKNE